MKNKISLLLSVAILSSLLLVGFAWGAAPSVTQPTGIQEHSQLAPGSLDAATLAPEEISGLEWMVEEEKLAHDVYVALYELWGQNTFLTISGSEAKHVESVRGLLAAYGLEDPSANLAAGEYADAELQALYETLVAQGSQSLLEALRVGAAIEEIDILDLQERLGQTDEAEIRQVYTNLMNASGNHLRAFVRQIERQSGATYEPQYLSEEAYAEIVGAPSGGQRQGRSGGRRCR